MSTATNKEEESTSIQQVIDPKDCHELVNMLHPHEELSTATYLERLTRSMITDFITGKLFTSPLVRKHVHDNFIMANEAAYDCKISSSKGLRLVLDAVERFCRSDWACVRLEPYNITAVVHRGTRFAEVYCTFHETARWSGQEIGREACSILHWERRLEDGVWMLYGHTSLRGGGSLG